MVHRDGAKETSRRTQQNRVYSLLLVILLVLSFSVLYALA